MQFEDAVLLAVVCVVILILFTYEKFTGPNVVTLYYTNWCGYCKTMKPIWNEVKQSVGWSSNIVFNESDEDRSKTPGVVQFPTIKKQSGIYTTQYEGGPDVAQLRAWVLA